MWFNPGALSKNKTEQLANSANPANYEPKSSETDTLISKLAELAEPIILKNLIVTCYTPAGSPIEVEARDQEHAAWLLKMNPKPKGTP